MAPLQSPRLVNYALWLLVVSTNAFALQLREDTQAKETPNRLKLHMMPDKGLEYDGAVCLDGSDAGFYFAPAKGSSHRHDWQIVFEGGGWCYTEKECAERALSSSLGSSSLWDEYYVKKDLGGFMSDDCKVNPVFCEYNRVLVPYCDGTSFTGNRYQPVEATKPDGMPYKVYLRGSRIVDAVLDALFIMGLSEAHNVLLSGWSAGAMTALMRADYVNSRLQASSPKLEKFRVVSISGFFLDHMSKEDESGLVSEINSKVYNEEFGHLVELANSSGALNQDCVAEHSADIATCMLAPVAYEFLKAPVFILNSGIDEWQVYFLATTALPPGFHILDVPRGGFANSGEDFNNDVQSWQKCFTSTGFQDCSSKQILKLMRFHQDLVSQLQHNSPSDVGNGVFVHSCPLHTEVFHDDVWSTLAVKGMTEQQAVLDWWESDAEEPNYKHRHLDCHLNPDGPPYTCNPTCPTWFPSLG